MNDATERQLLFGLLALQADLLDPAQFSRACSEWTPQNPRALAEFLVQRGWLTRKQREEVQRAVDRKLKKLRGDVRGGLAEVVSGTMAPTINRLPDGPVRQALAPLLNGQAITPPPKRKESQRPAPSKPASTPAGGWRGRTVGLVAIVAVLFGAVGTFAVFRFAPGAADEAAAARNLAELTTRLEKENARLQALRSSPQLQGSSSEAGSQLQSALALKPALVEVHTKLGVLLVQEGKFAEAAEEFRKNLNLDPDNAETHYNLGRALYDLRQYAEAAEEYRQALRVRPDYAEAQCNLGVALASLGKFPEAVAALRRGNDLGRRRSDWSYPSQDWLRIIERQAALDKRLPRLLHGQLTPADNTERLAFAELCAHPARRYYATSARLFADAFAREPAVASDPHQVYRYNAACAAVLASCGKGEDSGKLEDKQRSRLRRQALDWLQAELAALTRTGADSSQRADTLEALREWRTDQDLDSVRDASLGALPSQERDGWQRLWNDVDDLQKKLTAAAANQKKKSPKEKEKIG